LQFSFSQIPGGESGTDLTVRKISQLANESLTRPYVRLKALDIINSALVPNRATVESAEAIFDYVIENIRYVPDPVEVETVQDPEVTLTILAGDCDDHSALVAALAQAIGIPARYRVVGNSRDHFSHIFPELNIDGKWYPADTTAAGSFGDRVPNLPVEKIYNFKGEIMNIGSPPPVVPVDRAILENVCHDAAWDVLSQNWKKSLINRNDIKGYLRVIDEGNFPGRNTFAEQPTRRAISEFLSWVEGSGQLNYKPIGEISGLSGLDGFLSSIWNGVKKAVGTAVNFVTGGGGTETVVVQQPVQQAPMAVPAAASSGGFTDILKSPVVLVGAGVLGYLALRRR